MKNNITLTNDTINELKKLFNEIDEETNKPCMKCNIDTVTFNQYKILDTIKDLLFKEDKVDDTRKVIDCPTVILKLHLYDMDEDDNYIPMEGESLEESINDIRKSDDVAGFTITDFEVTTEKLDVTDWD